MLSVTFSEWSRVKYGAQFNLNWQKISDAASKAALLLAAQVTVLSNNPTDPIVVLMWQFHSIFTYFSTLNLINSIQSPSSA